MTRKILVFGESDDKGISASTKELLGAGSRLCTALAAELEVAFINVTEEMATEAIHYGANIVHIIDNPKLDGYQPEFYLALAEALCKQTDPEIVLFAHNYPGADLAPRVAFRLAASLTTDCTDLSINPVTKRLVAKKPVFGGNITATHTSEARPQMATVREKIFSPLESDSSRKGEIVSFAPETQLPEPRIKYLKTVVEEYTGKKLEDAEVIVSGGRGMGSQEDFNQLGELTELLDGALGGSRPAVEKGWIHPRFQVGLTGVRVSPKLYIAVGISGAIQHVAGVLGSKTIVAINKDADANIFKEAHYGVVGDYKKVLPAFKERLKQHLGKD
ncbi:MAG: electron transfer flavoprotein subunit alpha/FixB family protein [Pseudomonadota bacterium]